MDKLNTSYLLQYRKINIKSIEYIIGILYCFSISYFIALAFSSNILFHTDTFAPIEEIKLLINVKGISLNQLHLARIPSLFPDLAMIYVLIKFFKLTDIYMIISLYSIINSFLLLLFSSLISSLLVQKRFSFLYSSILLSTISLFLINKSSFYRDALSNYLTPLHQGGNIIMTLICILLVFSLLLLKRKIFLFNIFLFYLMPFLIGFSLTSNKLFVFTFLAPVFLLIIYLEIIHIYKSLNNNMHNLEDKKKIGLYDFINSIIRQIKLYMVENINSKRHRKILFISMPILIFSFSFQYFLDLQCLDPISFKFYEPIEELYDLTLRSKSLIIFSLLNLFLTIYSLYGLYKIIKASNGLFLQNKINSNLIVNKFLLASFIGLSSLSPFFYIWVTNNVISRYLLILPLFTPITMLILINLLALNMNWKLLNTPIIRLFNLLCISLFTLLIIFNFKINLNSYITINNLLNPSDIFYKAALIQRGDYARDYKQIQSLGLQNGLSDFWGSSVSYFGEKQINVSPILTNGTPNLWSHSINYFINQDRGKIREYNFVYSRSIDFSKSIIDIYGNPDEIYQIDNERNLPTLQTSMEWNSESHFIFIYNNKDFINKIGLLFKDRSSYGCRNY